MYYIIVSPVVLWFNKPHLEIQTLTQYFSEMVTSSSRLGGRSYWTNTRKYGGTLANNNSLFW